MNSRNHIFKNYILSLIKENKKYYIDIYSASFIINILAITISLFSLQVYDSVIPSSSYSTLTVLIFGAVVFLLTEFIFKLIRIKITGNLIEIIDKNLTRSIFSRLLQIRFSEIKISVGTFTSQLRSYESLRSFLTSSSIYTLTDSPFIVFYLILIAFISEPIISLVAIFFTLLVVLNGVFTQLLIRNKLTESLQNNNEKDGYLFEIISSFETIKSIGNNKIFEAKWGHYCNNSLNLELNIRKISESSFFLGNLFQQLLSIAVISIGAYYVSKNEMTFGALIATSILSGRVLGFVGSLPALIMNFSTVLSCLKIFDDLYSYSLDNYRAKSFSNNIIGSYSINNCEYRIDDKLLLEINNLKINSGDSIAVFGPIGSGKSTLLRLLSGIISPTSGNIFLDNLNIDAFNRLILSNKIGYLPQNFNLFNGSLRDNLLLGINGSIDDDVLLEKSKLTGLIDFVSSSKYGLDQIISHSGHGLSGGQIQLIALTRIFLLNPDVLILDEPTSSLDPSHESKIINLFNEYINKKTVIVCSHRVEVINNFNRVIFLNNSRIILDGKKDWVFEQIKKFR